jgi:prevent-host-death family protein
MYRRRIMAEVGVAQLRRELKDWIDRARSGDEVVVTDHGRPVARISGIDTAPLLDQLTAAGRLGRPRLSQRPTARSRQRVTATDDVAASIVSERDTRR